MNKVTFSAPTIEDRAEMDGISLDGRTKITVQDPQGHIGYTFMLNDEMEMLGKKYIEKHAIIKYSEFCEQFFVNISQNDYYNDVERFPEKTIVVVPDGIDGYSGREIYIDPHTKRRYLRENFSPREQFAKWYSCGKKLTLDAGLEVRANITFVCNGQKEKVTYDDWNGAAAYSSTFNVNFGKGEAI